MKTSSQWLLACIISFSFAATGMAAESAPGKPTAGTEKKSEAAKEPRYRGEITSLNAKRGNVKIKGRDGEKTFVVGDKAKGSLDKFKVGDTVRVKYIEQGGKLSVQSISEAKRRTADGKTGTSASKEAKDSGKPATK
jgi:Cu/Ag efflux protein CusF